MHVYLRLLRILFFQIPHFVFGSSAKKYSFSYAILPYQIFEKFLIIKIFHISNINYGFLLLSNRDLPDCSHSYQCE